MKKRSMVFLIVLVFILLLAGQIFTRWKALKFTYISKDNSEEYFLADLLLDCVCDPLSSEGVSLERYRGELKEVRLNTSNTDMSATLPLSITGSEIFGTQVTIYDENNISHLAVLETKNRKRNKGVLSLPSKQGTYQDLITLSMMNR